MMTPTRSKLHLYAICLALAVATLYAFEEVRLNDFVHYDDDLYVTENPHVNNGFTAGGLWWSLTTGHAANWHPLTWLSHMLDCELFGLDPVGHHLTNVCLHAINALILFWILNTATGAVWRSLFVAAAFALHPLHVESVAWVAERKDVLSGLFFMLTLAAYTRYVARPGRWRYLLVVIACVLGLMAKPMLVTLPFVLVLFDYWPLHRFGDIAPLAGRRSRPIASEGVGGQPATTRRLIFEKLPLAILAAASCVVTLIAQRRGGAVASLDVLPFLNRLTNALVSYVGYLCKILFPSNLAVLYPYPRTGLPVWQVVGSLILLAGVSAAVLHWRRRRYLAVGWLWYVGMLVPVIGLIQVGAQAMADRYTYLPSIGIFIMVGWGAAEFAGQRRYSRVGLALTAGAALVILLICTRLQVRYWRDDLVLFGRAVQVTENNYAMHTDLGHALAFRGRFDEAMDHCRQALRIKPDYAHAYGFLGFALQAQGKVDEALSCCRHAVEIQPNDSKMQDNLGSILAFQGRFDEAISHFREASRLTPDSTKTHDNLANALLVTGRLGEAAEEFRASLRLQPDRPRVLNNLAWILATGPDATAPDHEEALRLAQHAAKLTTNRDAGILDTLAAAYAATGRFDLAVTTAEAALMLTTDKPAERLASSIRLRLELYRQAQPYREAVPTPEPASP